MPAILRAPTREYATMAVDSHRWDGFVPRADDIIVATYPKCGTTWTQRIVDLLLFQSPDVRPFMQAAPWLDATFFMPVAETLAALEAQTHRRSVKSHLPFDALPLYDEVKYIHVTRNGRDACLSMHNHRLGFRPEMLARMAEVAARDPRLASQPRAVPADPRAYFLEWMDAAESQGAAGPDLPFCEFETTYWRERMRPNLLLVHYADLKADLAGEMRRISDYLEIDTPGSLMPALARAATFETMKAQGDALAPQFRMAFDRGADRFLDKGETGRWKGVLTDEDSARYQALIQRKLSPSHANWVETGRLVAGDPKTLTD